MNILSIVFAAIYGVSGIILLISMSTPDMQTQVRRDELGVLTKVKLTYYQACFLDGDGGANDVCTRMDGECNHSITPESDPSVIESFLNLNHTNGGRGIRPGDYNNRGGIFPATTLCLFHNIGGPFFIIGFVCALVCAGLQVVVCLGLCSSMLNSITSIVGFVSSICLLIGIIIFGGFPVIWDLFQKEFLGSVDDAYLGTLNPSTGENHSVTTTDVGYYYDRGALLVFSSFALLAIFVVTILICCCCKNDKE
eukprot:GHVR01059601.1.p1 GENE.GHVR01059601.1~~GHVR01059601.1.p1  ORF type:complete len:252 (+),score=39.24 GHVR01059601.1:56-811(+)